MSFIDLHTHTNISDGSSTPAELLKQAASAGLKAIAITDHDRVEAHHLLKNADVPKGLELVPGIEFSSDYKGVEIHILGLYVDVYDKELNEGLAMLWESRKKRNLGILDRFLELSIGITREDLKDWDLRRISKAHFSSLLVQKGYAGSFREAYKKYFTPGGIADVERERLSAEETIRLIKGAGGGAFLAHLNQIAADDKETVVKTLVGWGLCGIEGIYPEYNGEMTRYCRELSEKYGLLLSGGSDYHGSFKKDIYLGRGKDNILVPYRFLEKIKEYLGL